ncbi:hypothetical protein ACFE04_016227 [Oxalis oulophora]
MASMKAMLTLVVVIMVWSVFEMSHAAARVYKVGDNSGWTTIGNVDYKQWAATKNFKVGDIIRFEYNAQFHNVMQVTHAMYRACNVSAPLATYTTGNDSVTVTKFGHHYFLCGVPGHCQSGQKVDINVLHLSGPAPTLGPSSQPSSPSSSVPVAQVPGPTQNNANGRAFGMFELVMTLVLAAIVV